MTERPLVAYKILRGEEMRDLEESGRFAGSPVDLADGFIHLSTSSQIEETLRKHFAGVEEVRVAAVDIDAVADNIRWEVSRGGAEFPHLYAPLLLETVIAYGPVRYDADGRLMLPVAG